MFGRWRSIDIVIVGDARQVEQGNFVDRARPRTAGKHESHRSCHGGKEVEHESDDDDIHANEQEQVKADTLW